MNIALEIHLHTAYEAPQHENLYRSTTESTLLEPSDSFAHEKEFAHESHTAVPTIASIPDCEPVAWLKYVHVTLNLTDSPLCPGADRMCTPGSLAPFYWLATF